MIIRHSKGEQVNVGKPISSDTYLNMNMKP